MSIRPCLAWNLIHASAKTRMGDGHKAKLQLTLMEMRSSFYRSGDFDTQNRDCWSAFLCGLALSLGRLVTRASYLESCYKPSMLDELWSVL